MTHFLEQLAKPKSNKEVRVYQSCVVAFKDGLWRIFVGDTLFREAVNVMQAQAEPIHKGRLFSLFEPHLAEVGVQKINRNSKVFMFHRDFVYQLANRELEERIKTELGGYGITVL